MNFRHRSGLDKDAAHQLRIGQTGTIAFANYGDIVAIGFDGASVTDER
jgi:hypothetical protein